MKPTMTRRFPAATSASTMRSQASRGVGRGFSQKPCLPASMLASTYSSCVGPPGGDNDGIHLGVGDDVLATLQVLRRGERGGDRLRPVEVHVGHRGYPRAR